MAEDKKVVIKKYLTKHAIGIGGIYYPQNEIIELEEEKGKAFGENYVQELSKEEEARIRAQWKKEEEAERQQ